MPTDRQIIKKRATPRSGPNGGRPTKNKALALLLFKAGKSISQVAIAIKASTKTAGRYRKEFIASGELVDEKRQTIDDIVEADFDEECERAVGYKYSDYIKQDWKQWSQPFNMAKDAWEHIWNLPSLVLATDRNGRVGDRMALDWLKVYKDDKGRIRRRKKLIRPFFTFLKREDINKRFLTMPTKDNPRNVKKIPEISVAAFVDQFIAAMDDFEARHPEAVGVWVRTKLCLMARTGNVKDERGLRGLSRDTSMKSHLFFDGDAVRGNVFEKFGENWPIIWLPARVRDELKQLAKIEGTELYFKFGRLAFRELTKDWRATVERHTGIKDFDWHALRKVSITWFYVLGIPLEVARLINVGWKDLNVIDAHYMDLRAFMKKSEREAYAAKIPDWFKDGLEEYIVEGSQAVVSLARRRGGK